MIQSGRIGAEATTDGAIDITIVRLAPPALRWVLGPPFWPYYRHQPEVEGRQARPRRALLPGHCNSRQRRRPEHDRV